MLNADATLEHGFEDDFSSFLVDEEGPTELKLRVVSWEHHRG
jgi:hypothetical protein